jgi:hypothetical protein
MIRALGAIIAYFCIATVLAAVIGVSYAWHTGRLDERKLAAMAAVLEGIEPRTPAPDAQKAASAPAITSVADRQASRDGQFRLLELREQALENRLKQVRFEKQKLDDEKQRFELDKLGFERRLGADKLTALQAGSENARLLLESVKPKQSKELIMQMLEADEIEAVVTLFSAMPIAKRAKIAAEFKTEDETKKLDEILRRIRQGQPEVGLIDEELKRLKQSGGPTE